LVLHAIVNRGLGGTRLVMKQRFHPVIHTVPASVGKELIF